MTIVQTAVFTVDKDYQTKKLFLKKSNAMLLLLKRGQAIWQLRAGKAKTREIASNLFSYQNGTIKLILRHG